MEINVIHNEKDYQLALRAIAPYFDAKKGGRGKAGSG